MVRLIAEGRQAFAAFGAHGPMFAGASFTLKGLWPMRRPKRYDEVRSCQNRFLQGTKPG